MCTTVRLGGLVLGFALGSFVPAIAQAERPATIRIVGDTAPADGIPRSTYVVQDVGGVSRADSALGGAPAIFYLNKSGGTFRPGNNDARTNYSSIVDSVSTVPAWNVSAAGWTHVVDCMRDMFDRWNVTITDQDPGNVPHWEIVIAGRPQDVGMQQGVGGVSPYTYDCSVISNSIVYTFAEVYGNDYQAICETSAQEIAHSFGLDHEYLCEDPMTYLYNCGDKAFQDVAAPCGEYSARECACGDTTQNSVEWLNERLGPAGPDSPPDAGPSTPPPDASPLPPEPDAGPGGGGGGGGTPDAGPGGGGGGGGGNGTDDGGSGTVTGGCSSTSGGGSLLFALAVAALFAQRRRRA